MGTVNRSLRGWANYFHYRNSSLAMNKVRNHAEARLRTHLMKRHKVKARRSGLGRFPHADLYGRYGLYKVPVGPGWRSAHALALRTSESRVRENCMQGLMRGRWSFLTALARIRRVRRNVREQTQDEHQCSTLPHFILTPIPYLLIWFTLFFFLFEFRFNCQKVALA